MQKKHWFKTYIFIWVGQFISLLSSSAVNFAIIIWLSIEFKSAEVLAFSAIAGLLPQGIIGPFAGVFIDRWNRKKVMIFADLFIASCTILMTFAIKDGHISLNLLYLLMACRSIGSAFHSPAMQAIAPLIVPEDQLIRVAGINQMLQSISSIAGPALGTLAIANLPINKVIYLDVIGATMAVCSLLFVQIPQLKVVTKNSIKQVITDLKLGLATIYRHHGIRMMFFYSMIATMAILPIAIMFPLLTIDHFGGKEFEMSVIEVIWGIGMLIGGSVLSIFQIKRSKVIVLNAMHILLGLTFLLSGVFPSNWFPAFVLVTGFGGLAMSIFSATFMTIIQEEVPPEMLGRVFSLYFSFAIVPSLVGLLFAGSIADVLGIANAFILAGLAVILVGVLSYFTPSLMHMSRNK